VIPGCQIFEHRLGILAARVEPISQGLDRDPSIVGQRAARFRCEFGEHRRHEQHVGDTRIRSPHSISATARFPAMAAASLYEGGAYGALAKVSISVLMAARCAGVGCTCNRSEPASRRAPGSQSAGHGGFDQHVERRDRHGKHAELLAHVLRADAESQRFDRWKLFQDARHPISSESSAVCAIHQRHPAHNGLSLVG